jgi:Flp pilus assembly pilin Flp
VNLISLLIVGMVAVVVLGGVGSNVTDIVNRLRRIWTMLSPPPM